MKKDAYVKLESSFLSCERDIETILRKLFVDHREHADILKRLLVIESKDCLDNNGEIVTKKIQEMSLARLRQEGYIKLEPKIKLPEFEERKAYIVISFDNFIPNETNPFYRDCLIHFDIICHTDYWDIGNYRLRPFKIAGYIDGLLNNSRLSGIGLLEFIGCSELILNEDLSGYTLTYRAVHMTEDKNPEAITAC